MNIPLLHRLKGNARGCLKYEPFFLIPYSMYSTYATLYMYQLGVDETGIGLITSLGLVMSIVSSLMSGYLTDRMGRKRAILYFDLLSWTLGTLIWAFAQNIWFFVAAALVNGFAKIPNTAFYCLLVEDTPPKERSFVFTVLQFVGVVGGLFAPLGGLIVNHYTLVPGMRILYGIACVFMTYQFIGRHFETRETEMGYRKMEETRQHSAAGRQGWIAYFREARPLFSSKPLLLLFGVYILFNFQSTLKSTFLSLYMVEYLHVREEIISLFPALSSIVMLLFLWLLLPRIPERALLPAMQWGFALSVLSTVLLLLAPTGDIVVLSLSTVVGAVGTLLTAPYLETVVANALDDSNRANLFAILSVFILVFTSPAGVVGGWSYKMNPMMPFYLTVAAFALCMVLLFLYQRMEGHGNRTPQ
ncbi:MFS transporter [Gorillibacterium sp. CAU 1737]|uniref:MFS transporter n=1 Tax=Gorillibacterium sp. CAU 1737 TaxID=3140362 RepID=UPI003260FAEA